MAGRIAYKSYISINRNLFTYKNWKQYYKIAYVVLTLFYNPTSKHVPKKPTQIKVNGKLRQD